MAFIVIKRRGLLLDALFGSFPKRVLRASHFLRELGSKMIFLACQRHPLVSFTTIIELTIWFTNLACLAEEKQQKERYHKLKMHQVRVLSVWARRNVEKGRECDGQGGHLRKKTAVKTWKRQWGTQYERKWPMLYGLPCIHPNSIPSQCFNLHFDWPNFLYFEQWK